MTPYLQIIWYIRAKSGLDPLSSKKRKKKHTENEPKRESDIGEQPVVNSNDKSIEDQKPKTSPIIKKKRDKVHIQVGLDFGTSSAKVAFSQLGRRTFRVINFNHGLQNYPSYCIPSIGYFGDNGRLLLGVSAAKSILNKEWDSGLQRLNPSSTTFL